jgi:hypothetical protein
MKRAIIPIAVTLLSGLATVQCAFAQGGFTVVPFEFDPYGTHLVAAEWKGGLGCPTNANTAPFLPPDYSTVGSGTYTDLACPSGDPSGDTRVEGLLLVKTGPQNNDASAGAVIQGVKGTKLKELGYDLRKPGSGTGADVVGDQSDPRGSQCDAEAPRFNIVIEEDPGAIYFLACNSPSPDFDYSGQGWQRLRWGSANGAVPLMAYRNGNVLTNISNTTVKRLSIVFDSGQDTPSNDFGLAVLDNIDVNGTLVGRGPNKPEDDDRDEGQGEDSDHDKYQFHDSPSRPESSNVSYQDQSQNMKLQSVNGARSVTYNGACVTVVGDALVNEEPGYLLTFAACNLSGPLGIGIGNLSVAVTGPSGVVYQKSAALTSGYVSIHPH